MISTGQDGGLLIAEYLDEERRLGRVVGPLNPAEFPRVHYSPMGLVPKGSSGKFRLIVDLSSPHGGSVNDGIGPEWCSLEYVSVDSVAVVVARLGRGTILAKVDIRSAYRLVPVHPDDRWLLGMSWENELFVDTVLPFGLRSAPKIFTAVADAIEWSVRSRGVQTLYHYLDDFLLIARSPDGAQQLDCLMKTFSDLGVPIAEEKLKGPGTVVTFLGIEIDTDAMVLRLPQAKISELKSLVRFWLGRGSCQRKELQSLAGKLQHACKVVKPGRAFLRRIFELLATVRADHHHVRLNASFRSDVVWWDVFLEAWNGTSLLVGGAQRETIHIFSDASGRLGCGAHWGNHWFQFRWPGAWGGRNITLKEILPVVLACGTWGHLWVGLTVVFHVDNESAVGILNSGYSKEGQIMHLVRCLFFITAHHDLCVRARHIPGADNVLADAISRGNLSVFFSLLQTADPVPVWIPEALIALLVTVQPDWTSPSWSRLFTSCLRQAWRPPR